MKPPKQNARFDLPPFVQYIDSIEGIMAPEAIALLASISFALFAVFGWLGLRHSTPLTGAIASLVARTVTLGTAVVFSGGIPRYRSTALAVFVFSAACRAPSVYSLSSAAKNQHLAQPAAA